MAIHRVRGEELIVADGLLNPTVALALIRPVWWASVCCQARDHQNRERPPQDTGSDRVDKVGSRAASPGDARHLEEQRVASRHIQLDQDVERAPSWT